MVLGHGGNILEVARHYGIPEESIIDFSASINPLPLPKAAIHATEKALAKLQHYPDIHYTEFKGIIGNRYGIPPECILTGNGSTEHIYLLPQVLKPTNTCIVVPSYIDYAESFQRASKRMTYYSVGEKNNFHIDFTELERAMKGCNVVILGSPNNPTGIAAEKTPLLNLINRSPEATFIVDEAFMDFYDEGQSLLHASTKLKNLIVLRSLTKFFGIPGLRLGFLSSTPETVEALRKVQEPWTVNCFAEAIGSELLKDIPFQEKTREIIKTERQWLFNQLSALPGVKPLPSNANFILVEIEDDRRDSQWLWEKLAPLGILIRRCNNFREINASYFRIAVRLRPDNERLFEAISRYVGR